MEGTCCAPKASLEAHGWATMNFGAATLDDVRRTRRLVAMAAAMMERPRMSLPKQFPHWSDLMAAYRFLSNDDVDPLDIIAPHIAMVRQQAREYPVVLHVKDDSELDFTLRTGISGLGQTGDGHGRGLLQHAGLAVLPNKQVLGILDLAWHAVQPAPQKETRRERQSRWNVSDVWHEAVEHVGQWNGANLLVQVGDRHADVFRHLRRCVDYGHHFVIRATHDRHIDGDTTHLWEKVTSQAPLGTITVRVGVQRDKGNHVKQEGREAVLTIRTAPIRVPPPRNDPRTKDCAEVEAWAIHLVEENPPEEIKKKDQAIEWMLLSSLPAADLESAKKLVGYYTCRWVIEEWHRCYKEGCRIEASQLDDAKDIQRLGAILAVVAVRLLQMRDLADEKHPDAQNPAALQALVPPLYIRLVAKISKVDPSKMTPRQFFLAVAKKGGYLGRKRDPRPGWIVMWRGWYDIVQMVRGAELLIELQSERNKCV
jgi:hypothetical protein